ncbi:TPA: CDGSH iron-sulfur domain-containing protein [Legionella pneumophila]|uniref:CDGSH iron-sulfur domain-containing protein n=1 Tax=Legionella pneumophila TaxID=446 RepID=UPI0007707B9E|nr:CDGSH iron-sulfur domain-containing protein [Legionella pneumophila]HCC3243832.1 CDGSH iron-sulfur domain-containing protein [Legionella pneumophila subsp. pneumophila]MCZ4806518.1 CDGSH iron-sulfur domain-containing protein [Legionella pneumophila]MDW8853243.1 CDGSH iron-sulfur domain-containing protein [Legionella pneumophila]MDW8920532.1 CDGSH iron-sulfur domain-containing protein [Legionella pneumophila]MDW8926730.1 CDGSH iron-sulfur domain-containing protein [Legionella pneumophila]
MDDNNSEFKHLFPIAVEVTEGKTYVWCGCGKSKTQPFCDKGNCGDKAVSFIAELTEDVYFCNCKQTKSPPFCDGSHAKILLEVVKKRQNK